MGHVTRQAEIDAVFDAALDRESGERAAWLDVRCAGDPALRAEVDALLVAHARADGILDRGLASLPQAGDALADRRIGPWRIVRELGRGGMGVVYLAERDDGEYERQVAIKLLRASPDAEDLSRRFLAERQILASLSHPSIAALLDGGTTDDGLPYLVMEYVDGLPITTWCDRQRLDVTARLRLFVQVCQAVHAAHQRLVIHRDLKPGNVFVTHAGEVKLLDFGIAKLLDAAAGTVDLPHTRTALRMMTPEYASPEQVRGETLGTASDIYALGVVLYELLAGRRPYRLRTASPRELWELVCEREPERPSAMAARTDAAAEETTGGPAARDAAAAARGLSPERLARRLRGDVDAIVMKALRKEPRGRYASAELMGVDIARHLDGRPVLAQSRSRAYSLRKFLGRHRVAVAAGALATLALAGTAALAVRQAAIAGRERDRANVARAHVEQALRESEEMTDFLVGLFEVQGPATGRDGRAGRGGMDDLLRRGEGQVAQLGRQPLVQARMLDVMGRVYRSQGRFAEAHAALARSVDLRRRHAGATAEGAATLVHLGDVQRRQGRYAAAESTSREALALRRRLLGDRHSAVADVLSQLAGIAVYRGDLARAESLSHEALRVERAAAGGDDPRVARRLELLAAAVRRRGRVGEAATYLTEAIAIHERSHAAGPAFAQTLLRLAELRATTDDRREEALPLYDRALVLLRESFGDAHPQVGYALHGVCALHTSEGRHAEAERACRQALAIQRRTHEPDHPAIGDAHGALASAHLAAGRLDDAERERREAVRISALTYGTAHTTYAGALGGLADIALARGRLDEAERIHREVLDIRRRALGPDANVVGLALAAVGDVRARRGDLAGADSLYREGLRILRAVSGDAHGDVKSLYGRMARVARLRGDTVAAERYARLGMPPRRELPAPR